MTRCVVANNVISGSLSSRPITEAELSAWQKNWSLKKKRYKFAIRRCKLLDKLPDPNNCHIDVRVCVGGLVLPVTEDIDFSSQPWHRRLCLLHRAYEIEKWRQYPRKAKDNSAILIIWISSCAIDFKRQSNLAWYIIHGVDGGSTDLYLNATPTCNIQWVLIYLVAFI